MRKHALAGSDPSLIRYAQVWEDADVLLEALDVQAGDVCVSIASAGDNALALLTKNPSRVIAVDVSAAQLACLQLRVAAYRVLSHRELLELVGSRPSVRRLELYDRCRPALPDAVRTFWDDKRRDIALGIGGMGKLERYFALFRQHVLPLVHDADTVHELLLPKHPALRRRFYEERWNTRAWRLVMRAFFSRSVMAGLGRDRSFFRHAQTSVGEAVLERVCHALTELDPAGNPYAHWILTGRHGEALPYALRPEHFETIRANLDRLECRQVSLEDFVARSSPACIDRFNLSDVFEYVSEDHYAGLLAAIIRCSRPGARLAYWNMLVPRSRPDQLSASLQPLTTLADRLHAADRAFFYGAFRVEQIREAA